MYRLLAGVPAKLVLKFLQFGEAAHVAFFAGKLGVQVDFYEIIRKVRSNDSCSQDQDIHIVMLNALMGRVAIVTDSRSYPRNLVNGDGGAYAASAYQYSSVCLVVKNRHSQSLGIIRIIGWLTVMSPNIQYLMPQFLNAEEHLLFHLESGMIGTKHNAHTESPCVKSNITMQVRKQIKTFCRGVIKIWDRSIPFVLKIP
jgi:hypothetical protein